MNVRSRRFQAGRGVPVLAVAALAFSVAAGGPSRAAGPNCAGQEVITNTVTGAGMTSDIAAANPQYAQMAALVATVDPAQQDWARSRALQSLRAQGYGDEQIFDLLFMQAKSGQQMKQGLEGVGKTVMGSVIGGFVGSLAGDAAKGAVGGGMLGAAAGFATGQYVSIVVEDQLVAPVFARLIANPCTMTAAEALAEIARP